MAPQRHRNPTGAVGIRAPHVRLTRIGYRRGVSYFREFPADAEPAELLRPENHFSTPWGEPEPGPCDKCSGERVCEYRCRSCLEVGADPGCPACQGRVQFADRCPTCAGEGVITQTRRAGVSVFPELAGLLRYLVEHDFDFSGSVVVELNGILSDEADLDADQGVLLIHPTAILTRHPIDSERVADLRRRLAAETA